MFKESEKLKNKLMITKLMKIKVLDENISTLEKIQEPQDTTTDQMR